MAEWVKTADVFAVIDKNGISNSEAALAVGRNESVVRRYRTQENINFNTADRLLTALGMGHLLSDGSIESFRIGGTRESTYERMKKRIKVLEAENERLRAVLYPPSPHPIKECKDFVSSLDSGEPNW